MLCTRLGSVPIFAEIADVWNGLDLWKRRKQNKYTEIKTRRRTRIKGALVETNQINKRSAIETIKLWVLTLTLVSVFVQEAFYPVALCNLYKQGSKHCNALSFRFIYRNAFSQISSILSSVHISNKRTIYFTLFAVSLCSKTVQLTDRTGMNTMYTEGVLFLDLTKRLDISLLTVLWLPCERKGNRCHSSHSCNKVVIIYFLDFQWPSRCRDRFRKGFQVGQVTK